MVSTLDFGLNGLSSSPGRGTALCSSHFTLIVPLSTQVYKWVPANLIRLGVTLRLTSISSRGE